MKIKRGVKGQVWVETVLYTLIALVLIGLSLAFIVPKIAQVQDKIAIEQSINLMNDLDNVILSASNVAGNKRVIDLSIKKGTLKIDSGNDSLLFEIKSDYQYSEYGQNIKVGEVNVKTEEAGSTNLITLTSNQSSYDITYNGEEILKEITQSSSPYRLSIENKGKTDKTKIDFVVS